MPFVQREKGNQLQYDANDNLLTVTDALGHDPANL